LLPDQLELLVLDVIMPLSTNEAFEGSVALTTRAAFWPDERYYLLLWQVFDLVYVIVDRGVVDLQSARDR